VLTRRAPQLHPRRLKLITLHHPRLHPGPKADWELDRGFRLRVLTRDSLLLYLRSPQFAQAEDFLSRRPLAGEESFLLIPAPSGQLSRPFGEALDAMHKEGWWPDTILLMSDWKMRPSFPFPRCSELRAALPAGLPSFVAWVFQEMPTELARGIDTFTPEQNLYQPPRAASLPLEEMAPLTPSSA
jgi:hypothetical protein